MDLSEIFMEYRRKAIRKAGQLDQGLICDREYHTAVDRLSQVGNMLKPEVWEVTNSEIKKEYKLEPLDPNHVKWYHKIGETARSSVADAKKSLTNMEY
ncbi:hypothetical protein BDA99DRAFT_565035 [Phascolomyces articulosus]|uniref:Uncharacterized protein n=1 Tax=Phascolomyces articulosus TaxID=60185 RepID=A0AAD5P8K7_9FUNG|nr:hypothetical protein BDA99DRAFT_565035 [Phascolomyces articulosus]